MSKSSQRRKKTSKPINAATPNPGLHNVDKSGQYTGAARFIEIAPPGVIYRATANVDHITDITFGEKYEDVEVVDVEGVNAEYAEEGGILAEAVPPVTHIEHKLVGYIVCIQVAGRQNEFSYKRVEIAIAFYNELLGTLSAVGVPCALQKQMIPPAPPQKEAVNDDAMPGDDDLDDPLIDELEDIVDELDEAVEEPTQH